MTNERFSFLMESDDAELTPEEIAEGWHFCWDWDGLLVKPGTPESEACTCFKSRPWLRSHLQNQNNNEKDTSNTNNQCDA